MLAVPTFVDVLAARLRIADLVEHTPLRHYHSLGEELDAEVAVKHENLQRTGSFKVRGGLNLLRHLEEEGLPEGVVTASTGNHGQSIAYAAGVVGVPCTVCVPREANPIKVRAMRELGAAIVEHGADFDEARHRAEEIGSQRAWRYIHSGDEPDLIAGVGTSAWEVLCDWPEADVLIVPVGGGSQAAGTCVVAKAVNPTIKVVGVQSEASPAAYHAWRTGRLESFPSRTIAEGLDTGTPFSLPQRVLRAMLDDFVLVSDDALLTAAADLLTVTKTLVEPTASAPLAGARAVASLVAGKRAVLWCSGANIASAQLAEITRRQQRAMR